MRRSRSLTAAGIGPLRLLLAAGVVGLCAGGHGIAQAPPRPAPPMRAATMDEALALITESRKSFASVRDYTCTLVKRERVRGRLMPENYVAMKVRNSPFSVSLRWLAPRSLQGQEVCYVAGRNQGMMRVHTTGLAGVVGFVSVDPLDPRAFKDNRHPITEAGLGHLIDGIVRQWEKERLWNKTTVRVADAEFAGRPCTCIEIVHPDASAGTFYGYRCVLCLDKATHLPVHTEAYDWPRPGRDGGGELLESYSFLDLRCNVGLGEETFDR
jgi:hypothetical protein